jgi:predicted phage baseplate assembly protein
VSLPEIVLDDRRFQDLVNEARVRITNSCPEWTEHNVSDPGITLIELFAWLTETIIYRLNRVPDKLHVALLELLGIRLAPPSAAMAELRFRLAGPATDPIRLPAETEVGTLRTAQEESIVFQTDDEFVIPPASLVGYAVKRGTTESDVGVARGAARPTGANQLPFGSPPKVGDALYLGFDAPLARLVLEVSFDCSQARGAGIDPTDPPLVWEVPAGEGWSEAEVLSDRTGGFNYGSGIVELQLPARHVETVVAGQRAHWLRCRVSATTRSGAEGVEFTHPPEIYGITAAVMGASLSATHAVRERAEDLGVSDGTPAQRFRLAHAPMLSPRDETLEVLEPRSGEWHAWEQRESFVESGADDRHFVLDPANGEVELGPAVRETATGWRQYGAIPLEGARLRFGSYRHGGGARGNVAPQTLTTLKSAIPGIASVTNPKAAYGGVDQETLDSARRKAAMVLRTRSRAVTPEDFEFLALQASPRLARAHCIVPMEGVGAVRIHLVPRVEPADRPLQFDELQPDVALRDEVAAYLDQRRLVGTRIELLPAELRGVSVVVKVKVSHRASPQRVKEEIEYALYTYLNPLVGGSLVGPGDGWPFGRTLNQGDLFGIVQSIDGVEFVSVLRMYEADVKTRKQQPQQAGTHLALEPGEVIASAAHLVEAEYADE